MTNSFDRKTGWLIALLVLAPAVAAPAASQPRLAPIGDAQLLAGSPLHIPLIGSAPEGQPLVYTATSNNEVVTTFITTGNRNLRIRVTGFGEMVFELFETRVPRATARIIELAESGFYSGIIFHRVIDDFVIQGGDPTGTGSGGSALGRFDDQFHVDLQHNRRGLLSMAKSSDDTNDSQFFITENAARHLDFNHSIFGLLLAGESVRDAISNVSVDTADRPVQDVVMESVEVFLDPQTGVLMLNAPEGTTGTSLITVTATNADGEAATQTFRVDVTPDGVNSPPFLADVPPVETTRDTAITIQLEARDVEGDIAFYLDQVGMTTNGLAVPVFAHPDLLYAVNFDTGVLNVSPTNGLTGTHFISVATAVDSSAVDYQVIPVVISPPLP